MNNGACTAHRSTALRRRPSRGRARVCERGGKCARTGAAETSNGRDRAPAGPPDTRPPDPARRRPASPWYPQVLHLEPETRHLSHQLLDLCAILVHLQLGVAHVSDCGHHGRSTASTTINRALVSSAAWAATRTASGSNGTASVARITTLLVSGRPRSSAGGSTVANRERSRRLSSPIAAVQQGSADTPVGAGRRPAPTRFQLSAGRSRRRPGGRRPALSAPTDGVPASACPGTRP